MYAGHSGAGSLGKAAASTGADRSKQCKVDGDPQAVLAAIEKHLRARMAVPVDSKSASSVRSPIYEARPLCMGIRRCIRPEHQHGEDSSIECKPGRYADENSSHGSSPAESTGTVTQRLRRFWFTSLCCCTCCLPLAAKRAPSYRLCPGGPNRNKNAAGIHRPSLDREHSCLHFSRRQAHPQYLRQMSKVRLDQLKRDPRNGSLSILRRRANGRGCIL